MATTTATMTKDAQTHYDQCKEKLEERTRELRQLEVDMNPAYIYTPAERRNAAVERLPTLQAEVEQATEALAEARRDLAEREFADFVAGLPHEWAEAERRLHTLNQRRAPLEAEWSRANAIVSPYAHTKPTVSQREQAEAEIRHPALRHEWLLLKADIADAEKERDRARSEAILTWRAQFREQKIALVKQYDSLLQKVSGIHDQLVAIEEAEGRKCGAVERCSWFEFDRPTPIMGSRLVDWRHHLRQEGLL